MTGAEFWIGLLQIVSIDIFLGGDNAVVIALACKGLPERERKRAMTWGIVGAVGIRVLLIFFALMLLRVPYLKLVAALLLFWIGVNLLGAESPESDVRSDGGLFSAIRTIIVADTVMSLDNIIGVAGAAKDNLLLIVIGISISVPLILWGSSLVLKTMDRFPVIIVLGAGLIGWISGGMLVSDAALDDWVNANAPLLSWGAPASFAIATVLMGKWLASKRVQEFRDLADIRKGRP